MSTNAIHSLPVGLIANIAFDEYAVILSFLSIGVISFYIFHANKRAAIYGLFAFLVMISFRKYQHFTEVNKPDMVFYDTRQPLVDIIMDGRVYCYAHPFLTEKNISFATRNFRIYKRAEDVIMLESEDHLRAFYKENEHLLKSINEIDSSDVFDRSDLSSKSVTMR